MSAHGRSILALAACAATLLFCGTAWGDGVVPSQGQQLRVGTKVTGVCTPQAPDRPLDLGADDDGTPYHGTYVSSAFAYIANGQPGDPVSAGAWDPGISTAYRVPPTDGVTPDRCGFRAGNGLVQSAPLLKRGLYVMHVITTNYHEHFDSVTAGCRRPTTWPRRPRTSPSRRSRRTRATPSGSATR